MKAHPVIPLAVVVLSVLIFNPMLAVADSPELLEGIDLYKQEAYGAAEAAFIKARQVEPENSTAAFFLGLTYKQRADFPKAAEQFEAAVTLTPRIKEALIELIDVLTRIGTPESLAQAEKWIAVAEKEGVFPAKTAFLKGMLLGKQGKNDEAIASFEKSKNLDPNVSQSAEFQIAMSHLRAKRLDEARQQLDSAVLLDPNSDLASFARQYQDSVSQRLADVWRFTVSASGLYDSNLLLRWNDVQSAPPWPGGEEETPGVNANFRVDYRPVLKGNWLFNAQFAFDGNWYQNSSTDNDTLSAGIYAVPGYNFGKYSANLALNYNNAQKKRPYYQDSSEFFSIGPLFRFVISSDQLIEFFAGFDKKEFELAPIDPRGDRDSDTFRTYVSWFFSNVAGAFVNLRLAYLDENANGEWWSNVGAQLLANATIPATDKLRIQLSGQGFWKDFDAKVPDPRVINGTSVTLATKRRDDQYQGILGFNYELWIPDLLLIGQYTYTRNESTVAIYDYDRQIISAGLEYRF